MIWAAGLLALAGTAGGLPYGDAIPKAFWGAYARSARGCADKNDLARLEVTADRLSYYEADEYLILGVAFEGSSDTLKDVVPMINGRFTARQETNILGELNLRLAMEKPNVLVRFIMKDNGEPDETQPDRWVRCPNGKL
ncbi:hypothetical protein GCM10022276_19950 [Sphingomonas limnosediminicola]|uniref:Uncharacterized protein n=1 Tax=Sphingomonas limnosediminicola TaxID=940133 RepID=A0ABP7LG30_9SPHN